MRIISGIYRGTKLEGFDLEGTRPTMDRVKESCFAMIQSELKDAVVLDLFAGSGALGLEALSMGAKHVYLVDHNQEAIRTIQQNVDKLKAGSAVSIINQDYQKALQSFFNQGITFDIILLDPPYDYHYIQKSLDMISQYQLVKENGIIVCEYENESFATSYFTLLKERSYQSKTIQVYKQGL